MDTVTSKHRLALSLYLDSPWSALPTISEIQPWETARLTTNARHGVTPGAEACPQGRTGKYIYI